MSEEIRRARAGRAEYARLPWWGAALMGTGLLVMLATPIVTRLTGSTVAFIGLQWGGILVLLVGASPLWRGRSASPPRKSPLAHPAGRRTGLLAVGVAVAGLLVANVLAALGLIVAAVVAAVAVTAAVVGLLLRINP